MDTLMKYVSRLSRVSILHRAFCLREDGINGLQHSYILHICQRPGITQEELAQKLYVHKSNVARQVALLEKNGYSVRVPSEADRRAQLIFPTEKMLAVYPKVCAVLEEWNEYLLEGYPPERRQMLLDMLSGILERAQRRVRPEEGEEAPL